MLPPRLEEEEKRVLGPSLLVGGGIPCARDTEFERFLREAVDVEVLLSCEASFVTVDSRDFLLAGAKEDASR